MSRSNKYKLHYIGKGLYTVNIFEHEAKKYGVQRAVSFSQLKTLKFGTPILLASFSTQPKLEPVPSTDKVKKEGVAEVFSYFTFNGISHTLPKELSQLLQSKLTIIKTEESPFSVSRACGSYSVGGIAYIKEDLKTLLEKIEEVFTVHNANLIEKALYGDDIGYICVCPKCNNEGEGCEVHAIEDCITDKCGCCTHVRYGDIDSHKWFITGKYHPLTPFVLTPAKFARGIQTVTVEGLDLGKQSKTASALVWLYNYRQRHYLPKQMKDNLQHPTDPFKNVF